MKNQKTLAEMKAGQVFDVAEMKFVKCFDKDGITAVFAKDCLFESRFGDNNNFAESKIMKKLESEYLPKIEKAIGAENVALFETDLRSLDGSRKYSVLKSKISLPTLEYYRDHVEIFDMHKTGRWFWLATPWSTSDHLNDYWILCVSPRGVINYYNYYRMIGVRPFLFFVSSISVSCED